MVMLSLMYSQSYVMIGLFSCNKQTTKKQNCEQVFLQTQKHTQRKQDRLAVSIAE